MFFTKCTLFAEKIFLCGKKVIYWKKFLTEKTFFAEQKYKKYVSHLKDKFL